MRGDEEGDGDDIAASARKDVPSAKELRRSTNRDSSEEVRLRAHIQKLESMDASLLRDMDSASIGFVREFAYTGELNDSAFLKLAILTLFPILWLMPCIFIKADKPGNFWTQANYIYNIVAISFACSPVFLCTPVLFSWQCGIDFSSTRRLVICACSGVVTFHAVNFCLTAATGWEPLPFASFLCGLPACGPVLLYMYVRTPDQAKQDTFFKRRIFWCTILYSLMMIGTVLHVCLGVIFFANMDKPWQPAIAFCFLPLKVAVKKIAEVIVYKHLESDTTPAAVTFFEHLHAFYQATIMTRASMSSLVFLIVQDVAVNTFFMLRLTGLVDDLVQRSKTLIFTLFSYCCKRERESNVLMVSEAKLGVFGKSRFKSLRSSKSSPKVAPSIGIADSGPSLGVRS